MKKFVSIALVLAMMLTLAACGGKDADASTGATNEATTAPTTEAPATDAPETEAPATEGDVEAPAADTTTLEGIITAIYEKNPVEFMAGNVGIDLTDTSEDGLWTLKAFTGLENADLISEAMASEAMIGSIPFSMVLVRVADAANAESVADSMKVGIDQRKWICVEADDLLVTASGDVVMLIMIGSENGTAQSFVDAFAAVMGSTDFVK